MVSSTWLIVRTPLTKNARYFGVYIHSENTYSLQGMPQSHKREVTAMHGVSVSHVMNHCLIDPFGALTLYPPAHGCCRPPVPIPRSPTCFLLHRESKELPALPALQPAGQSKSVLYFLSLFFFLIYLFFANLCNKCKPAPTAVSPLRELLTVCPGVALPHTDSGNIHSMVKQISAFAGKRVVSPPLYFTYLYLTLI